VLVSHVLGWNCPRGGEALRSRCHGPFAAPGSRPLPHRSRGVLAVVASLLLVCSWPLAGFAVDEDGDEAVPLAISGVRVEGYPEVSVTVNVPQGAVDTEAPQDAFTLLEDGDERDLEVRRLQSEDLEVALILDTSGSMAGAPLEAARQAALDFTARMPEVVQLSVIAFSTEAALVSDFTADRQATTDALTGLSSGGWTAMYDALHVAMDLFDGRDPARRAIVLLSDGGDNRSTATLADTIDRLEGGEEFLHVVELITAERPEERERFGRDEPGVDEADLEALESLAAAADQGQVASPQDLDTVSEVYEGIAATLMNQFELTYASEAAGATRLTVRLEHGGDVVETTRDIELPSPAEDAQEEIPTETDQPATGPQDDGEDAAAVDVEGTVDAPGPNLLEEPWVLVATVAAVIGGFAFLVYYAAGMLGWRA
jgi:VWFA-related protein